ncbi:TetR/AcrR family transcriptional regulator [Streptomonospora sp. S1-112]|uniref:TetR/AcrR family transcriptional regulator n=1 Tax=Streptomonospora mangrovi TaxID=2883123 RepID=A0A9X3NGP1_9ACTN|nr:TetR/AcrR family transcriptional regulator [Streptomonospora mangrovi]MDA0563374.1 TetR/AcrR family transcriptional regulator [Streptomonospora mangrovi]
MTVPLEPFGKPRGERADAARNRERLLEAARAMIAEQGTRHVTMDALAERAGLGKGTVFRRFGSRAGIFQALLDDDERRFQERVLSGPPPLGPGADPAQRLDAYGCARIPFLLEHHAIARAAVDRTLPVPAGAASMTQPHIRMLLGQAGLPPAHLDGLAVQLTAALEGPLLLYLSVEEVPEPPAPEAPHLLVEGWRFLIGRLLAG